jgi:hypothetical protein
MERDPNAPDTEETETSGEGSESATDGGSESEAGSDNSDGG